MGITKSRLALLTTFLLIVDISAFITFQTSKKSMLTVGGWIFVAILLISTLAVIVADMYYCLPCSVCAAAAKYKCHQRKQPESFAGQPENNNPFKDIIKESTKDDNHWTSLQKKIKGWMHGVKYSGKEVVSCV